MSITDKKSYIFVLVKSLGILIVNILFFSTFAAENSQIVKTLVPYVYIIAGIIIFLSFFTEKINLVKFNKILCLTLVLLSFKLKADVFSLFFYIIYNIIFSFYFNEFSDMTNDNLFIIYSNYYFSVSSIFAGTLIGGYHIFDTPENRKIVLIMIFFSFIYTVLIKNHFSEEKILKNYQIISFFILIFSAWYFYKLRSDLSLIISSVALTILVLKSIYDINGKKMINKYLFSNPVQLFIISFALTILTGTLLLSFKLSSEGVSLSFIDSLFTATSATCVTGLIVFDTGTKFTLFGQFIILILIQAGGIGIMTISAFVTLLIRGKLDLKEETALEDIYNAEGPKKLRSSIKFIILSTFFIEAVGATGFFIFSNFRSGDFAGKIWNSVFHSISAFCNAGFSLYSDSLVSFNMNYMIILIVSVLIISGGLGFEVISNLLSFFKKKERLNVQTKLVLSGTLILLVSGMFLFMILEWNGVLEELNIVSKVMNSFFQSVVSRTAGFNSISMDSLDKTSILVFCILMFIGAGPGSTAGGIKITTAAVFFLSLFSILSGREDVECFGRRIPRNNVLKAVAITTISFILVTVALGMMLITQDDQFENILFEVISAFGTVGLSTGTTARLDIVGKFIISFLMFAGRIGPLTLIMILATPEKKRYQLPSENILVG